MDTRLEGQYSLSLAQKAANLALQCLAVEAKYRPSIDEVVTTLEQLQDSKDTPKGTQKEHHVNSDVRKSCRSSLVDGSKVTASYPRPNASLLFT